MLDSLDSEWKVDRLRNGKVAASHCAGSEISYLLVKTQSNLTKLRHTDTWTYHEKIPPRRTKESPQPPANNRASIASMA